MSLRYMSLAILLPFAVCFVAPAHAYTHFVASNGTDSGLCQRTAPCASVNQALINATVNDTIVCVDTTWTTSLSITKSIDIDCSGARLVVRDGFTAIGNASPDLGQQ